MFLTVSGHWALLSDLQKTSVGPQRVFKVVFLGHSGVGKTSFIHRFCTGQLRSNMNATVGKLCFHSRSVTGVTETHKRVPPGRYRLPDEDYNCGPHHRHSAALGHSRAGEVRSLSQGCIYTFLFGVYPHPTLHSALYVQVLQHHRAVLP